MGRYPDEVIKARVEQGYKWQKVVADYLRSHGLPVHEEEQKPIDYRDSTPFKDDSGDLWVGQKGTGIPIEVKSCTKRFTGRHDFPFDPAIVDGKFSWDNKKVHGRVVVCISQITQGMMWLSVKESGRCWKTEVKANYETRTKKAYYLASLCWWFPIEDLIVTLKAELTEMGQ